MLILRALRCCRDALDELGLHRYCCRRMVLTHVDLIDKLLNSNGRSHRARSTTSAPLTEARLLRDGNSQRVW